MTTKRLGIAAAVLVFDAVLLLIVGAATWREPPSRVDEVVGKALVTLGVVVAAPAVAILCAFLVSLPVRGPEPARSDWTDV